MASQLKNVLTSIEQGSSWISYDRVSGVGPSKVAVICEPGWMGRLPRETYVAVEKGRVTKVATIKQNGLERVSVEPSSHVFDMEGGTVVINARLNSASVKAAVQSVDGNQSYAYIVSVNVNGLSMTVPEEDSRYLVYADPLDPGATDLYDASFVVAMPRNMDNVQRHEMFILNGKVVNLTQQPNDIPYIDLDHDFDNVTSEDGMVTIKIDSNTDYDIELVCCTCSDGSEEEDPEVQFAIDPSTVRLNDTGDAQAVVVTAPEDTTWQFQQRT